MLSDPGGPFTVPSFLVVPEGVQTIEFDVTAFEFGTTTILATIGNNLVAAFDLQVGDQITGLRVLGDEDTVISGVVSATDVDGDAINFTLDSGPSNGVLTLNTDGIIRLHAGRQL